MERARNYVRVLQVLGLTRTEVTVYLGKRRAFAAVT